VTRRQSDQRNEAAIAAGERRYAASLDPDYRDRLRSQLETDELASRPLGPYCPTGRHGRMLQSNEPGGVVWACLTCGRSGGLVAAGGNQGRSGDHFAESQ